jgi:hypothetical protein
MIENNILSVSNAMFKNKNDWNEVRKDQKEQFFFIFNRFFSKKFLDLSFLLNDKKMNKEVGTDLWYEYMKTKPYPQWFWSKSSVKSDHLGISESNLKMLKKHLDIKDDELEFLIKHHNQEIIEELEYLKKLDK